MKSKLLFWLLITVLLITAPPAEAQQPAKVPRIGYLSVSSFSAMADRIEPFRQGLREPGYVEGKNILIDWRYGEGNPDRIRVLAVELVQLKVDVIVTAGTGATRLAKAATSTIPIVMAQDDDPVANGFVASLARPGGNITGLSILTPELSGKRLELMKEIIPKLSRVAVFGTSTSESNAKSLEEIKLAAAAMKVQPQYLDVLNLRDAETAFLAAAKRRADAVLWIVSGSVSRTHRPPNSRTRDKKPTSCHIREPWLGRKQWSNGLREEPARAGPSRRDLRGQDFERRKARRASGGTADEI